MYVCMRIYRTMYKLQTPPSNLATCSPNISISMAKSPNHHKSPKQITIHDTCREYLLGTLDCPHPHGHHDISDASKTSNI